MRHLSLIKIKMKKRRRVNRSLKNGRLTKTTVFKVARRIMKLTNPPLTKTLQRLTKKKRKTVSYSEANIKQKNY